MLAVLGINVLNRILYKLSISKIYWGLAPTLRLPLGQAPDGASARVWNGYRYCQRVHTRLPR